MANGHIYRFLDTVGNGSGTKNANVDGSVSPVEFLIKPSTVTNEVYEIHRMIVTIGDSSGMSANEYGNLGVPLTNGITVQVKNDSNYVFDLLDGSPVTHNAHWGHYCFDAELKDWGKGQGDEQINARWTFTNAGAPLKLVGANGDYLVVTINDNCTGLDEHYFMAQGQRKQ